MDLIIPNKNQRYDLCKSHNDFVQNWAYLYYSLFFIMHQIRKQVLPTSEDIAKKLEVLIKEWMKGDIPESEYLPFDLLLLEPAAF